MRTATAWPSLLPDNCAGYANLQDKTLPDFNKKDQEDYKLTKPNHEAAVHLPSVLREFCQVSLGGKPGRKKTRLTPVHHFLAQASPPALNTLAEAACSLLPVV